MGVQWTHTNDDFPRFGFSIYSTVTPSHFFLTDNLTRHTKDHERLLNYISPDLVILILESVTGNIIHWKTDKRDRKTPTP